MQSMRGVHIGSKAPPPSSARPAAITALWFHWAGSRRQPATDKLTAQELRVALMMADGATVQEAATQLFLSPKTVEAHLGRAYRKLGVRNRVQLAPCLARDERDAA